MKKNKHFYSREHAINLLVNRVDMYTRAFKNTRDMAYKKLRNEASKSLSFILVNKDIAMVALSKGFVIESYK